MLLALRMYFLGCSTARFTGIDKMTLSKVYYTKALYIIKVIKKDQNDWRTKSIFNLKTMDKIYFLGIFITSFIFSTIYFEKN